jgi:hypothetical protein
MICAKLVGRRRPTTKPILEFSVTSVTGRFSRMEDIAMKIAKSDICGAKKDNSDGETGKWCPHVCYREAGHGGKHQCGIPVGKRRCGHRWGQGEEATLTKQP